MASIFMKLEVDKEQSHLKVNWTSPNHIDGIPKEIYFQYHGTVTVGQGFDILPMYLKEYQDFCIRRKYSLLDNEKLNKSWKKFMDDLPHSENNTAKLPSVRDLRFKNYHVRCNKLA